MSRSDILGISLLVGSLLAYAGVEAFLAALVLGAVVAAGYRYRRPLVSFFFELGRKRQPGDFALGKTLFGRKIWTNLAEAGCILIVGVSRFGKSTLIRSILHQLIQTLSPKELRIGILDLKEVDLGVYHGLRHLVAPIARSGSQSLQVMHIFRDEMRRRQALFRRFDGQLCDKLERYQDLSGERLPLWVLFCDEVSDLTDEVGDGELEYLAKKGRAFGIYLVLATQRPTVKSLSGEIISQMTTKLCGWMVNWREFTHVALIPKEHHPVARQGYFAGMLPSGWVNFQGIMEDDREIERVAAAHSGDPLVWGEVAQEQPEEPLRDQILALHQQGKSITAIQRELFESVGGTNYYRVKRVLDELDV